ncbi:MAG: DUF362 domain-containing protein [Candidatus Eisenbacteria bacterium]|nr:DUF362 domain-containing protein [Candidatus Eisenbacteria bacterium]
MPEVAKVYFAPVRSKTNRGLVARFGGMLEAMSLNIFERGDLVAVKLTFGEEGCTTFVHPIFVRKAVDWIKEGGGKPFLTDSCTLYLGERSNGIDHLNLAVRHGFSHATIGAPIVIADGIASRDYVEVEVGLKHFKKVRYGANAHHAHALFCISHFKGHLGTGFGGTFKNIGMGLGSRSAKQKMHAVVKPEFRDKGSCTGCARCVEDCPSSAIRIVAQKATFDYSKCSGCGECISVCPERALRILWNESPRNLCEKIVETAYGVLENKKGRAAFFNFVLDVTPDCDCLGWSDNAIVPNVGILGSIDPVAVEQASLDMVNAQPALPGSGLGPDVGPGADKFKGLRLEIEGERQIEYAEELGMGTRRYEVVNVDTLERK